MRIASRPLSSALLIGAVSATPALGDGSDKTVTCRFPGFGEVVIDTRRPGPSIVVDGSRHPASGGSYFFQTTDGPGITLMFGPGAIPAFWTYQAADGANETTFDCVRGPGEGNGG